MLGIRLFSELDPKFFGILTGPNARLYVDVFDALEREMPGRGDVLDYVEALAIIDGCAENRSLQPEDDVESSDQAQASSVIYRRLIAAKWLEEEKHSDYRRTVFLDPAAQTLLEAFRTIVSQSIASFTGRLRLVCDRLAEHRLVPVPVPLGDDDPKIIKRLLDSAHLTEAEKSEIRRIEASGNKGAYEQESLGQPSAIWPFYTQDAAT